MGFPTYDSRTIRSRRRPWSAAAGDIRACGKTCPAGRPCCYRADARCSSRRTGRRRLRAVPAAAPSARAAAPCSAAPPFGCGIRKTASWDRAVPGSHRRRTGKCVWNSTPRSSQKIHSWGIRTCLQTVSAHHFFVSGGNKKRYTYAYRKTMGVACLTAGLVWRGSPLLCKWHLLELHQYKDLGGSEQVGVPTHGANNKSRPSTSRVDTFVGQPCKHLPYAHRVSKQNWCHGQTFSLGLASINSRSWQ